MCPVCEKNIEDGSENKQWIEDGEITNRELIKTIDDVRDGNTNTCTNWNYHYLIIKRILRDNGGSFSGFHSLVRDIIEQPPIPPPEVMSPAASPTASPTTSIAASPTASLAAALTASPPASVKGQIIENKPSTIQNAFTNMINTVKGTTTTKPSSLDLNSLDFSNPPQEVDNSKKYNEDFGPTHQQKEAFIPCSGGNCDGLTTGQLAYKPNMSTNTCEKVKLINNNNLFGMGARVANKDQGEFKFNIGSGKKAKQKCDKFIKAKLASEIGINPNDPNYDTLNNYIEHLRSRITDRNLQLANIKDDWKHGKEYQKKIATDASHNIPEKGTGFMANDTSVYKCIPENIPGHRSGYEPGNCIWTPSGRSNPEGAYTKWGAMKTKKKSGIAGMGTKLGYSKDQKTECANACRTDLEVHQTGNEVDQLKQKLQNVQGFIKGGQLQEALAIAAQDDKYSGTVKLSDMSGPMLQYSTQDSNIDVKPKRGFLSKLKSAATHTELKPILKREGESYTKNVKKFNTNLSKKANTFSEGATKLTRSMVNSAGDGAAKMGKTGSKLTRQIPGKLIKYTKPSLTGLGNLRKDLKTAIPGVTNTTRKSLGTIYKANKQLTDAATAKVTKKLGLLKKKKSPKKELLTGGGKIRRKSKVKKEFSKDTIQIKNR
tara:strand:- start:712 stop:2682 length:1971 start_codon:yes stop_codon:yes gene_type:complete